MSNTSVLSERSMQDLLILAGAEAYEVPPLMALKLLTKLEGSAKAVWLQRLRSCVHGITAAHPSLKATAYNPSDYTTWLDWSAMSSRTFADLLLGLDHIIFYGDVVVGIDVTLDTDAVQSKAKKLKQLQPVLSLLGVDTVVVAHVQLVSEQHPDPTTFSLLPSATQQKLARGVRTLLAKCAPSLEGHKWCRRWVLDLHP